MKRGIPLFLALSVLPALSGAPKPAFRWEERVRIATGYDIQREPVRAFLDARLGNRIERSGASVQVVLMHDDGRDVYWGQADVQATVVRDSLGHERVATTPGENVYSLFRTPRADLLAFSPLFDRIDGDALRRRIDTAADSGLSRYTTLSALCREAGAGGESVHRDWAVSDTSLERVQVVDCLGGPAQTKVLRRWRRIWSLDRATLDVRRDTMVVSDF